ncbi:Thioesterase superfamily protein [uncultured delta proteobacterium]|uniref:Thioesterase superfamily protein n=1 Tax=uncultured delta proteobacterium TaxID=34034 RepID=A0A212KDM2_9DELT|nr:Thioesterase superfamily protein [uncultured delta proteobacterium]
MSQLNPAHIASLLELLNQSPYSRLLSMEITAMGPGHALVAAALGEKHRNTFGGLHGGVHASVIETAAYWALYCDLPEDAGMVTLDLAVTDLAPAKNGELRAEARRIKAGRTICLAEVTVTDATGKLLAHGTSKLMVTPGLQSVRQSVAAMGREPLPPKFLDS